MFLNQGVIGLSGSLPKTRKTRYALSLTTIILAGAEGRPRRKEDPTQGP